MARRKKLGIVPRLLKGAVTVGVIPACAVTMNEGCAPPPPVVAAYGDRMMPVVAAYPTPTPTPEPIDAGPPLDTMDAGDAGDAGAPMDAGAAPTSKDAGNKTPTGPATVVPKGPSTMQPPVVAAYPRGTPFD